MPAQRVAVVAEGAGAIPVGGSNRGSGVGAWAWGQRRGGSGVVRGGKGGGRGSHGGVFLCCPAALRCCARVHVPQLAAIHGRRCDNGAENCSCSRTCLPQARPQYRWRMLPYAPSMARRACGM